MIPQVAGVIDRKCPRCLFRWDGGHKVCGLWWRVACLPDFLVQGGHRASCWLWRTCAGYFPGDVPRSGWSPRLQPQKHQPSQVLYEGQQQPC